MTIVTNYVITTSDQDADTKERDASKVHW